MNQKSNMEKLAPVVLFCYNRPEHTRMTLEALSRNSYADNTDVYAFLDAPKTSNEIENVNKVKTVLKEYECKKIFNSFSVIERDNNYGLAKNIIDGVTSIVNKCGKVIVLEDDIVTHYQFLRFMNEALSYYENCSRVMEVCGYLEPIDYNHGGDAALLRVADCWGWATWKRSWQYFEKNPEELLQKFSHRMIYKFNLDGAYGYFDQVRANADGEINTWAVFWYTSVFVHDGLAVYPTKTLVKNIGWDIGEHADGYMMDRNIYDESIFTRTIFGDLISFPDEICENKSFLKAYRGYYLKKIGLKARIRLKLDAFWR